MKNYLLTILFLLCIIPLFASQQMNTQNPFGQSTSDSTNIYEIQKLKLYPNPANDYLTVEYDVLYVKEAKFQIYNSIGAIVYTKTLNEKKDNLRIQVSEYKSGLYFCSLQIDGKLLNTRKILINH